ncbi:hypothetical protein GGX14DRAFT_473944 [Mycena pura]|uniref:Xylanolytic transcriptional activator regulatory domain-containing protein n=1 Tax=Mycena pura TaxID=153505 RepID=A0AAD6Y8I5_9AGAR|nr:hypothetical protein GGX14DRAFT_473944 [Mycena pura]
MEGRSRTQQLEETIKKLHSRIGELEAAASDGQSSIFLHEPYDSGDVSFLPLEIPPFVDSWTATSPSTRVNTPTSSSSSSSLLLEEPPADIMEALVDAFLNNFTQVGFFLDPACFRESALLACPFGHYKRPSPALLSAVYMWGARLSQAPLHPLYNEDAFLVCALQNIHQDLGGQHPHRVMHSMQAEVLLSVYYLTLGRPVEGIYHSSAAVSLAISAGLHMHKSASQALESEDQGVFRPGLCMLETPLPPARGAQEETERIRAFWTVVVVNNYWVAAHGSPSAIPYADTPIDTPWPCDVDEYADAVAPVSAFPSYFAARAMPIFDCQHLLDTMAMPQAGGGAGTVARFLSGLDVEGFSALALLSKASILMERAITFSTRYSGHPDAHAFDTLDAILQQLTLDIPLGVDMELSGVDVPKRSILMVTQSLAHAAIIRLHAHRVHTSDTSRSKYFAAARAVVRIINVTDWSQWRHMDPIMGILWTIVCEVFIAELTTMQSFGVVGRLSQQHQDVSAYLETILTTMRNFASTSPLIEYFSTRVQQAYSAVLTTN